MEWWIVITFYICSYVANSTIYSTYCNIPSIFTSQRFTFDISRGIAGSEPGEGVPTWPTLKLPLNAVSPGSQRATELPKLRVKMLVLFGPILV